MSVDSRIVSVTSKYILLHLFLILWGCVYPYHTPYGSIKDNGISFNKRVEYKKCCVDEMYLCIACCWRLCCCCYYLFCCCCCCESDSGGMKNQKDKWVHLSGVRNNEVIIIAIIIGTCIGERERSIRRPLNFIDQTLCTWHHSDRRPRKSQS